MDVLFGESELASIRAAAAAGCRLDGRGLQDLLPFEVQPEAASQAAGSARLRMGDADVLVGVKAEIGSPSSHHPDEGSAEIAVTIASSAAPAADARALELEGASVAGHLQQLMLTRDKSGAGLDLRSLGIITGKACWVLYIDCIVLSSGGSLLVALSAAIHKALQSTSIPRVSVDTSIEDATAEDIEVDADAFTRMQLDTSRLPVVLTPCQIGAQAVLGATLAEQAAGRGVIHISVDSRGRVCGLVKAGKGVLDVSVLQQLITAAQRKGRALFLALQEPLEGDAD